MKKISAKLNKLLSPGQTIIEVLIATMVVAVVMTAIASTLTSSIRNTTESKFRSLSTSYAQEGLEVFRREKLLLGWASFQDAVTAGTFCLNDLPADTTEFLAMPTGNCTEGVLMSGTELTREGLVTVLSSTQIRVEVTVTWYDGDRQRQVTVTQEYLDF
jgi:type II secretory pathway pseudopilin PulG